MTTTLVYNHDDETVDLAETDGRHPAYSGVIGWGNNRNGEPSEGSSAISPSGQYAYGGGTSDQITWVADLTVPSLEYKLDIADTFLRTLAIDDEGTMWGHASDAGSTGAVISVDLATQPTRNVSFTIPSTTTGNSAGLRAQAVFTFTMPGGAIKLVIIPASDGAIDNTLYFLGTKGTPGLTTFDTAGAYYPCWALQDDNGDIWLIGTPRALGSVSTMIAKRLTSVSAEYTTPQTFTMPEIDNSSGGTVYTVPTPVCFFAGGYLVGGWAGLAPNGSFDHLFRANLTTQAVTLRSLGSPGYRLVRYTPPDPDHWYVMPTGDIGSTAFDELGNVVSVYPRTRVFREVDPATLNDTGTEWNLDAWNAANDDIIYSEWWVDSLEGGAFVGCLDQGVVEGGDNPYRGDLFIYYFDADSGGGSGVPISQSTTVRVWGFMLDGHEFYVLRLGTSETLVYDRSTKQWSQWNSLGFAYWRAHIGGNWQGMTGTLADGRTDVVAGDDSTGVLWRLDPLAGVDDNPTTGTSEFTRMVIGGVPLDGREVAKCNAVTLSLSLGNPSLTGAEITLRTSDNQGHDWVNHGTVVTTAGSYDQVVEWRALGLMSAPGRVFEISDNGAAVRISAADMR